MWLLDVQLILADLLEIHDLLQLSWVKADMMSDHCWAQCIHRDFPPDTNLLHLPPEGHPVTEKTRYWVLRPIFYLCNASSNHYSPIYINYWAAREGRPELLGSLVNEQKWHHMLRLDCRSGSLTCFQHVLEMKKDRDRPTYINLVSSAFASGMDTSTLMMSFMEEWTQNQEQPHVFQIMLENQLAGRLRQGRGATTGSSSEQDPYVALGCCANVLDQILGRTPVYNSQHQVLPLPVIPFMWSRLIKQALLSGEVVLHDWIVQQAQTEGYHDIVLLDWLRDEEGVSTDPWAEGPGDVDRTLLIHHLQDREVPLLLSITHEVQDGTLTKERLDSHVTEYTKGFTGTDLKKRTDTVWNNVLNVALKYRRLRILSWLLLLCPSNEYPWLAYLERTH